MYLGPQVIDVDVFVQKSVISIFVICNYLVDPFPLYRDTILINVEEKDDLLNPFTHQVLKLRFPVDLRLQEIRRMLQSARPATISVRQRPEVSDHEFVEEQEKALLSTCIRTMALPVGRYNVLYSL